MESGTRHGMQVPTEDAKDSDLRGLRGPESPWRQTLLTPGRVWLMQPPTNIPVLPEPT
jgi:hypothetical protein